MFRKRYVMGSGAGSKRRSGSDTGPVFSTLTKTDTVTEWGLPGIKKLRSMTQKPLVAIGNINISNVLAVIKAGADCLAVVSAICAAENPAKAAELLRNELEKTIK